MSPSKGRFRCLVELVCIALFLAAAAWGAVAGSISGTVTDPSGSVVARAEITVQETTTGLTYNTQTDARGFYTLPVLPVGRYELSVQAPGFYRACGYEEFGTLDGYPGGVTRHWVTKLL